MCFLCPRFPIKGFEQRNENGNASQNRFLCSLSKEEKVKQFVPLCLLLYRCFFLSCQFSRSNNSQISAFDFPKKLFCIKTSFFTLSNFISIYLWITQMTQCPALPLVNFPPLSFHFLLLLSTFTFTFHFQDDTDDSVPSSPPSRSSTSPSPSLPSHSPTQAAQPSPLPQVGTVSNVNCNCPHTYTL